MSVELKVVLKNKAINEWKLFWLITGPISISMVIAMMKADLSSGEGVSSMIQYSVRCAIPWLYLAFAALFNPYTASRNVESLAVAQPEDHWLVFCVCDGLAIIVYRMVGKRAQ